MRAECFGASRVAQGTEQRSLTMWKGWEEHNGGIVTSQRALTHDIHAHFCGFSSGVPSHGRGVVLCFPGFHSTSKIAVYTSDKIFRIQCLLPKCVNLCSE